MCGVNVLSEKGEGNRDIPDGSITACWKQLHYLTQSLDLSRIFCFRRCVGPTLLFSSCDKMAQWKDARRYSGELKRTVV